MGGNHTFKSFRPGYEAGVTFFQRSHLVYYGLKYSSETKFYTTSPDIDNSLCLNRSEYLKMPLGMMVTCPLIFTSGKVLYLSVGAEPKYLLKQTSKMGRRMHYTDFNPYNLALNAAVAIPFLQCRYSVTISYSRDLFNNLKDSNIYSGLDEVVAKQKSKTNLLSLTLSYRIRM